MKRMSKILNICLLVLLLISSPLIYLVIFKSNVIAKETNEENIIYLDPGHGGIDCGGISNNGVYEKDINLKICKYLKIYLENVGYKVKFTRNGDYDLASPGSKNRKNEDILKRVSYIDESNCLLFVSIHCNIYTSNNVRGAQTFYNSKAEDNKILAESIQEKLIAVLKNTNRVAKSINGKYLIDNSKSVGCLVEVGFLSNPEELNLLICENYQEQVAYSVYLGIIDYIGCNNNL